VGQCIHQANIAQQVPKKNSLQALETFFSAELVYLSREKVNHVLDEDKSNQVYSSDSVDRLDAKLKSRFNDIWMEVDSEESCINLHTSASEKHSAHRIICMPIQLLEEVRPYIIQVDTTFLVIK
jgi:hypothetical protein